MNLNRPSTVVVTVNNEQYLPLEDLVTASAVTEQTSGKHHSCLNYQTTSTPNPAPIYIEVGDSDTSGQQHSSLVEETAALVITSEQQSFNVHQVFSSPDLEHSTVDHHGTSEQQTGVLEEPILQV